MRKTALLIAASAAVCAAAEPRVAFLAAGERGAEGGGAEEVARKLLGAAVVRLAAGGRFVAEDGSPAALDRFGVLWVHQGDSIAQTGPLYSKKTLAALKNYVAGGRGLFLSGAALAMVHLLGVEPINPRRGGPGHDNYTAALVPVERGHPVFQGLALRGNAIPVTDRGFPAFSDFHASGGPSKGMLLARTTGGSENPLAEYELGKGRIIVMGWRLPHYGNRQNPYRQNLERLTRNIVGYLADAASWRKVVVKPHAVRRARASVPHVPAGVSKEGLEALELAVRELIRTFGAGYRGGREFLARIEEVRKALAAGEDKKGLDARFEKLKRQALLANPLLDFDRLLVVKRGVRSPRLGLPANWQSNSSLPTRGYDDELDVLEVRTGKLATLFRPDGGRFVGDVDLHWDADRLLFSMPGKNGRWQVHELRLKRTAEGWRAGPLRELPLIIEPDVDNYDACYLPDGKILFTSTAPFVGVPCVTGSAHVSNIYRWDPASGAIRRLTFGQDHDWCPTVMANGRVLYLHWEYSDIPHFVSRILFHMNPDGTEQMEYYGSNSYWPNSLFYARPCPGSPTRFVGVVSGHHDVARMGELVLFDVARGRREAAGAVQRIPGRGKPVQAVILDGLVRNSWPKFLHPWPLNDKCFIVASKPTPRSLWGIYLVDVFDNMVLLGEVPGYALLEPLPLKKRPVPPVIPDRTRPGQKEGVVFIADIYSGDGLRGVPRGTVKKLRLFTYQFAYHGMGGQVNRVGLDGPWDVKRIVGTVPVEADGSACFRIPANTPIAVQPLDAEGKALQLMRSWMTAMPGERLSCVGCHERQNTSVPNRDALALRKPPARITPWHGPARGFSFTREVQPVLDAHCVGCHDGRKASPDLRPGPPVHASNLNNAYNKGSKFSPSYLALRRYVRSPTIESDIHLLPPCEFHADTARLVQLLRKGHYGVDLEPEAWDRLITWIDLGTPCHGTWHEIVGWKKVAHQRDRRREMDRRYANLDLDPEAIFPTTYKPLAKPRTTRQPARATKPVPRVAGWPFGPDEAKRRQAALGPTTRTIELAGGVRLELARIPPGEFVMGDPQGYPDERPPCAVRIERPFWMGKFEVTNEQFALFDPTHDSGVEHGDFLQFSVRERGYPLNAPTQPVCRVTWHEAMAFCRWLSEETGEEFTLPTEAQWEWACRAGSATAMWYGERGADFAQFANLADARLRHVDTFGWGLPSGAIPPWRPAVESVDDRYRVAAPVGSFKPNPWGLHDTAGNVAEWTRSLYAPYPYRGDDGRNDPRRDGRRVVRGGSWYDRPRRARSAFRQPYHPWQPVYDVGFRVICETRPRQVSR